MKQREEREVEQEHCTNASQDGTGIIQVKLWLFCDCPKAQMLKCSVLLRMLNSTLPWMCSLLPLCKTLNVQILLPFLAILDKTHRALEPVLIALAVHPFQLGNSFGGAPLQQSSCPKDASVKPLMIYVQERVLLL